jgi:hypothetical protein
VSCPPGSDQEQEACGDDTNGGCNSASLSYEPITAGVAKCGTFWADGSTRDTDWYSFSIGSAANVTWSVTANFPAAAAILDKNCPPGIFTFVTATVPCPLTTTFCLNAGDYAVFAATSVFAGNPCGSGNNDYVGLLTIGSSCAPLSTCCFASGGIGCDDPDCQAAVCGIDSFCCAVAWDSICAGEAASLCAICAGPAVPNDDCEGAIAISDGVTPFSTAGATTSLPALDPACERGFGLAIVDDIWFVYTATATGTVTVSLCDGTNYDSRIAAYAECGDETVIACNDDAGCGPGGLVSEMSFDTVCGEDYFLRIGGFSGSGSGNITITPTGTCPGACTGDINGDGVVDATDLGILLGGWGFPGPSDLNGDGTTDGIDLGILLGAWGPCP